VLPPPHRVFQIMKDVVDQDSSFAICDLRFAIERQNECSRLLNRKLQIANRKSPSH
jgi:hypothetical protein